MDQNEQPDGGNQGANQGSQNNQEGGQSSGGQEGHIQEGRIVKARTERPARGDEFGVRAIIGVDRPPLPSIDSTEPIQGQALDAPTPTPTEPTQAAPTTNTPQETEGGQT